MKIIKILIISVIFIVSSVLIYKYSMSNETISLSSFTINNSDPTPTPFLFSELTIPKLRERDYKSNLSKLEKYSETSTYTSYLTSYISDGLKINGLLTIPKTDNTSVKFPAIVFVHGYIPSTIYKTTEKYSDYVDYLARNGFVVFKIDLRGHGDSEGEASGAYYSEDYVIDTLNAYNALQSTDFVDPKRIGLWGHSMAGNVTFRSVVVQKDIPALVIWAGAVYTYEDMAKYGIDDNSYRPPNEGTQRRRKRDELRKIHGDYNPNSSFWKLVVPTNFLDGVSTAVQIHHASDDSVVNIAYSRDLMALLDKTSMVHELFEYPTGGHNITSVSFTKAMQRTVDFYKENL